MWNFNPLKVGLLPVDWKLALTVIQRQSPSAVIAGGALRDRALGGPIKDLDVFVPYSETQGRFVPPGDWVETMNITAGVLADYATSMRGEVCAVQEFTVPWCSIPVQIIHIAHVVPEHTTSDFDVFGPAPEPFALQALGTMDFDLCRVAHDGRAPIFHPSLLDAVSRPDVMTLVHCIDATQAKRSYKRAEKFAARYPGMLFDMTAAQRFMEPVAFLGTGI